ncbi:MAG: SDR family NAD(P)-dependent oxidoreductase, partial [Lachnospiraceae bacterium]|nr:SDR family NAD(P)-dependent oxidoreductase [Lachnospiraceae bacterium]
MSYKDCKFDEKSVFLVTGGAGFIGSNICEALVDMGYTVRCLDNLSTGKMENINHLMEKENFTFTEGDIRNMNTCMNLT